MNKRRGGSNSNRASSTNSVKVGGVAGLNSNSNSDNCGGGVVVADDEESNRLNSSAVRRIDPTFAKLHGTASQVAVYRYNSSTQSWDKTDTVGCLFLYERNVPPTYGLVVMNRKNVNNFIQKFGPDGQVVLHNPYLLLKSVEDMRNDPADGTQAIHCIWFYEPQDCVATASILKKMGLKFEGETHDQGSHRLTFAQANSPRPVQLTGNALFQILQKGTKESPVPNKEKTNGRVITAEELESQMLHESERKSLNASTPTQAFLRMANATVTDVRPAPLTKEQLTQSLMYLLVNDPDFVNRIHDAYVKSMQPGYNNRPF